MRTGVAWWDEERIIWYERAAKCCSFHKELSEIILNHIDISKPVNEIGCGLGHAAEILYRRGVDISASDRDPMVIKAARERSLLNIFKLHDAEDGIEPTPQLLMIFFGRIMDNGNLGRYLNGAERIIYILSEHSGQGIDTGRKGSIGTEKFLREYPGIEFTAERFMIPFPQPLASIDEARHFIGKSYGENMVENLLPFVQPACGEYPLTFMNNKKCTLFDIKRRMI